MSIDAKIETVHHYENGSGKLALVGESRGCSDLHFDAAPHDVTALNGRRIWGGDSSIMCGEVEIAKREGYTKIVFCVESVSAAIAEAERLFSERHPGSKPSF